MIRKRGRAILLYGADVLKFKWQSKRAPKDSRAGSVFLLSIGSG